MVIDHSGMDLAEVEKRVLAIVLRDARMVPLQSNYKVTGIWIRRG